MFGEFWFQFSARRSALVAYTGKNWEQKLIIKQLINSLKTQTDENGFSAGAAILALAVQLTLGTDGVVLVSTRFPRMWTTQM
jgi:hypothetical protein